MKKLLLALVAASCTFAFADTAVVETSKDTTTSKEVTTQTTAVHTFDQNSMKCGSRTLKDGSKITGCKVQPKEAGDDKRTVRFIDDNSGKKVKCEVNKKGSLVLAQCVSTD